MKYESCVDYVKHLKDNIMLSLSFPKYIPDKSKKVDDKVNQILSSLQYKQILLINALSMMSTSNFVNFNLKQ